MSPQRLKKINKIYTTLRISLQSLKKSLKFRKLEGFPFRYIKILQIQKTCESQINKIKKTFKDFPLETQKINKN